jgi:eukaryotic-like serine/threonine-protein kinase
MSSTRNDTAERSVPGAPASGEVLAGKYVVQGVVGSGGMGVVVSARHMQLGQIVAIKLLLVDEHEESLRRESQARFLREGQAAAQLRSDHVVRIYDVGTLESGAPFMVMELLDGVDLSTLLEQSGPLPIATAVDYVTQACHAVAAAHAAGIVHRDLKPSNLFLTQRSDGTALIKVLDFGISKSLAAGGELQASLTSTKSVVGSPYYMSPEQVRDAKRVDGRTDIWSLGMILYELVAGRPAFEADTLPGICAAIAADLPEPVRTFRPDTPPALEAVIMSCLEKSPARRPQRVEELAYALTPFAPRVPTSLRELQPELTVRAAEHRTVSPDAATLSAPSQPQVGDSGVRASRGRPRAGDRTDRTMASAEVARSMAPPARRWLVPTLGVLILGAGTVLLASRVAPPEAPAAIPAAPEAVGEAAPKAPGSFRAVFRSEPPGAEVREHGVGLGRTPLSISLEATSFASGPRVFTLELEGHEPFTHSQASSEQDVEVHAVLVPHAAAPSPAPPEEEALPRLAPRPAVRPAPRPAPPKEARPAPSSLDIRLER